jgi:cytochrome c5
MGSLDVTPTASTVYTLLVIGSDIQQVSQTQAIDVAPSGAAPLTARELFDNNVRQVLETKCGACHEAGNTFAYPDLFGTRNPSTYYDRVVADPRFLSARPEDSLLLLKGAHSGPAFLREEAQKVTGWLLKESAERGTGVAVAPPAPAGDRRPRSLAEAITRFGACMNREIWDQTYGLSEETQIAHQQTEQGECTACHSTGTAGAFLSASVADTFDLNRTRPYVLKLVLGTSNDDGSFKDLVPAWRYERKGGEGGDHPSYLLTPERKAAIDSFVDQTLVRFRDFAQPCP